MDFRIAQINDDPRGVLTGAFVFSPPPQLPEAPRVLVERFGAENTRLGRHGWAVDSRGLRPRLIEKRGSELWLCFGAEVSFHVLPNTPVRITVPGTALEGTEIWPPIPRGKAPPAGLEDDDAPWPEPPEEARKPEPKPEERKEALPPPKQQEEPPPPVRELERVRAPVTPPPATPPPVTPPPITGDPPAPPPPPPGPRWGLLAGLALLLLAGGGAAWWFLRPPPAGPVPPPQPEIEACAAAADVMRGSCTPAQMAALPPEAQTRLAEALLALPERQAGNVAVSLLSEATTRHSHAPAMLALARLYDPASFRQGGPLSAPNPTRALELYGRAAAAGLAPATAARAALVERLKQEASGTDPALAERAKAALAAAGVQ
jgi:hypothetical protein